MVFLLFHILHEFCEFYSLFVDIGVTETLERDVVVPGVHKVIDFVLLSLFLVLGEGTDDAAGGEDVPSPVLSQAGVEVGHDLVKESTYCFCGVKLV